VVIIGQSLLNMRDRGVLTPPELVGKRLTVGQAGGGRTI
jgi:hypothetical protein